QAVTTDVPLPLLLLGTAAAALFAAWLLLLRNRGGTGGNKGLARLPLPPGPRGWPVLGNLPQLGDKPHHTMAAMAREHGPLFRLRFGCAEVVVAASASVAAQFLRSHDANFSNRPPNSGAEHVAYNYQDLVFAPYGARWRALRKLCALHLFSARALDDLRAVREGEIALLVRELAQQQGRPVALGQAANVCATNTLARATVGRRVFAVGGDEGAREFKEMVVDLMQLPGVFNVGDFVPALAWLDPQGVVARMKRLHRRYDGRAAGTCSASSSPGCVNTSRSLTARTTPSTRPTSKRSSSTCSRRGRTRRRARWSGRWRS
ncbi:unnamed protein product, partial [Urochloa humidicola]